MKKNGPIGVGIIGASPDRGWAMAAHIPALRALPAYEFRALSTSRRESADAASRAFGIPLAFDTAAELVARPEVDLAVVSVKVPQHHELVTTALRAGKDVYCEWPLGKDLAEAEQLAALARERGVRTIVGLQARAAPAVRYVRDLVAEGFVGEVLSTSLVGTGGAWGDTTDASGLYLLDARNGATLLSIPFGHTVDALCWCLGEFQEVSATLATRRHEVRLAGTNETRPMRTADQVLVCGVLAGGAVASIHYRGGVSRGTNLLWEINGTKGDLVLTGDAGHLQMTAPRLSGGNGERPFGPVPIPERYVAAPGIPEGSAYNVAQAYAQYAEDPGSVPSFEDAVVRHRMLEAILEAARTGQRQRLR
ncbi:Gfo/Idh/MocA family protein [Archangium primigenium]|uniref:Gfo/Idh/MocA family protein n=1 Tax=[Archangium] primigenium TaxID=2792470 RepID=UPI001EF7BD31|nr:Gfo/Idh/MocA family oxidoreductase [Archangium primigenium]MBM7115379.1 Gfo/Idh/MocA family oxidoreductase [Archangium primigenium]